jgi:phosphate transport system substrate-binding protein
MHRSRLVAAVVATAALSLVAVACGGDSESGSGSGSADADLTGAIFATGSSTVEPITALAGESFNADNPGVDITVEGPGTGDGFKKFCAGEADIADASRKIKDEEVQLCKDAGVEYVELAVASDALTVVTNAENTAVACLKLEDLYGLVGPESDSVAKWSDAAQFGATTPLPDAELKIFAPGQESGTYDSFVELALEGITEERLGEDPPKATRTFGGLADDNEIIRGIQSSPTSFGWVGFAFAEQSDVGAIAIDAGEGCVSPTAETVADGTYPLSRTLYIYVNTAKASSSPALQAFVTYYLDNAEQFSTEAGYVALPADQLEASQAAWTAAVDGGSAAETTATAAG